MRIAIDKLEKQDCLSNVSSSNGSMVVGGGSIEGSLDISGSSNNGEARGRGSVSAFGDNLIARLTADIQAGDGYSRSIVGAFSGSS